MNKRSYCISTGSYIQYLVINYNGKESGKEFMYVCVYIYIYIYIYTYIYSYIIRYKNLIAILSCTTKTNTTLLIYYTSINIFLTK